MYSPDFAQRSQVPGSRIWSETSVLLRPVTKELRFFQQSNGCAVPGLVERLSSPNAKVIGACVRFKGPYLFPEIYFESRRQYPDAMLDLARGPDETHLRISGVLILTAAYIPGSF